MKVVIDLLTARQKTVKRLMITMSARGNDNKSVYQNLLSEKESLEEAISALKDTMAIKSTLEQINGFLNTYKKLKNDQISFLEIDINEINSENKKLRRKEKASNIALFAGVALFVCAILLLVFG